MPRPAELPCASVRDRIDPWLDGDLDPRDEIRVRRHLDDCAACREELRLARNLRQALRSGLPTLACPPEVTAEVMRRVQTDQAGQADQETTRQVESGAGWWRRLLDALTVRPTASPIGAWAAVAALLLVVAAVPLIVHTVLAPEARQAPRQAVQSPDRPTPAVETDYTPEQIAQAERQARLVLAAVAEVSRGAGHTVQERVFDQAVMRPARRAVASLERAPERQPTDGEGRQP